MKIIFLFMLLSFHLAVGSGEILRAKRLVKIPELYNYQTVIDYLKVNEGFSPVVYMDNGYCAQGFGQRLAFYPESIPDTISRNEAEIILKKSFANHINMVKRIYPKEKNNRLLALAHISYTIGIGYLLHNYKNNQLDTVGLRKFAYKEIREFEINLFNN